MTRRSADPAEAVRRHIRAAEHAVEGAFVEWDFEALRRHFLGMLAALQTLATQREIVIGTDESESVSGPRNGTPSLTASPSHTRRPDCPSEEGGHGVFRAGAVGIRRA